MQRKLLITTAIALPALLWLVSVPVFVALYGPPLDMWGLLNGLIILQLGIPLAYMSVPAGLIGLGCVLVAMRRYQARGIVLLAAVSLNLATIACGGTYAIRFEIDKTRWTAKTDTILRLGGLRDDLLAYAANHQDQLPDHLLRIRSVKGLQDEVDAIHVPGWSDVDEPRDLEHPDMPLRLRQFVADWVRDNSRFIYLGDGLVIDEFPPHHRNRIVLLIEREPLPRYGYPVLMLSGEIHFLDATEVSTAITGSNQVRHEHGKPPVDPQTVQSQLQ